jgi:hypothetical protein
MSWQREPPASGTDSDLAPSDSSTPAR